MESLNPLLRVLAQWFAASLVTRGLLDNTLADQLIALLVSGGAAFWGWNDSFNKESYVKSFAMLPNQQWENLLRQAVNFGAGVLAFKGFIPVEYVSQAVAIFASLLTWGRSVYVKSNP